MTQDPRRKAQSGSGTRPLPGAQRSQQAVSAPHWGSSAHATPPSPLRPPSALRHRAPQWSQVAQSTDACPRWVSQRPSSHLFHNLLSGHHQQPAGGCMRDHLPTAVPVPRHPPGWQTRKLSRTAAPFLVRGNHWTMCGKSSDSCPANSALRSKDPRNWPARQGGKERMWHKETNSGSSEQHKGEKQTGNHRSGAK